MSEEIKAETLTRGQKISLARKGVKWTDERKANAKAARELWEKNEIDPVTGKRKGYKLGKPPKAVVQA